MMKLLEVYNEAEDLLNKSIKSYYDQKACLCEIEDSTIRIDSLSRASLSLKNIFITDNSIQFRWSEIDGNKIEFSREVDWLMRIAKQYGLSEQEAFGENGLPDKYEVMIPLEDMTGTIAEVNKKQELKKIISDYYKIEHLLHWRDQNELVHTEIAFLLGLASFKLFEIFTCDSSSLINNTWGLFSNNKRAFNEKIDFLLQIARDMRLSEIDVFESTGGHPPPKYQIPSLNVSYEDQNPDTGIYSTRSLQPETSGNFIRSVAFISDAAGVVSLASGIGGLWAIGKNTVVRESSKQGAKVLFSTIAKEVTNGLAKKRIITSVACWGVYGARKVAYNFYASTPTTVSHNERREQNSPRPRLY